MFIRIPYYDAKKINILASKSCKNKYSDPNKNRAFTDEPQEIDAK
jgi:hypothetical protein